MNSLRCAMGAVLALLVAFNCAAGELLVTESDAVAKSGNRYVSIDLVTDGNVAGFNFLLRTTDAKLGSIDVSGCTKSLPKGFSGECRQGAKGIYFYAIAQSLDGVLPSGVAAIGQVGLPIGVSVLGIEELAMADAAGNALSVTSQVSK